MHSGRKAEDFTLPVPGDGDAVCAWLDVPATRGGDERSGTSRRRKSEANRVAAEVLRLLQSLPEEASVGVITFYAAQRDSIFQAMEGMGLTERGDAGWRVRPEHAANACCAERLRVGTVDAFQGKEFDVVLLSVVRSNALSLGLPGGNEDADWEKAAIEANHRIDLLSRQWRFLDALEKLPRVVTLTLQMLLVDFVGDLLERPMPVGNRLLNGSRLLRQVLESDVVLK